LKVEIGKVAGNATVQFAVEAAEFRLGPDHVCVERLVIGHFECWNDRGRGQSSVLQPSHHFAASKSTAAICAIAVGHPAEQFLA